MRFDALTMKLVNPGEARLLLEEGEASSGLNNREDSRLGEILLKRGEKLNYYQGMNLDFLQLRLYSQH